MIFPRRARALALSGVVAVSLLGYAASARVDGKVVVDAGLLAALAETYLRLPHDQIVLQTETPDGQWRDVSAVEFAVGAHPNHSESMQPTSVRMAPLTRNMTLVRLGSGTDGIMVSQREPEADLLTWLKHPRGSG